MTNLSMCAQCGEEIKSDDHTCIPLYEHEYDKERYAMMKFRVDYGLIFDHDFSGPVQHISKLCMICNEFYGKHVRNEIKETINELEDICSCDEMKTCTPHNAIDMFKRIIGEV